MQHSVSVMRTNLLAGIAVLLMATSAAHAGPPQWSQKPKRLLPSSMQGNWCRLIDNHFWKTLARMPDCRGTTRGRWTIWANGWTKRGDNCNFVSVDKLDKDIYMVNVFCKTTRPAGSGDRTNEGPELRNGNTWYNDRYEIHLVEDRLVLWPLPDA